MQRIDLLDGTERLNSNGFGEESDPRFEVAGGTDPQQMVLVFMATAFQPGRDFQHRHPQLSPVGELKDADEPPETTVAVVEGVQRLELVVAQRHLDDEGVHLADRCAELVAIEEIRLKDIVEGRIGAFQSGGADRLLPDGRSCQQARIRKMPRRPRFQVTHPKLENRARVFKCTA
jgi:hypothetical protein